jgi:HEAT repeat protein
VHATKTFTVLLVGLMAAGAALAQVPIVGSDMSPSELAGSGTLVTVVLQAQGAEDPNLTIEEATDEYIVVMDHKEGSRGEEYVYLYEDIQEIRVQEGRVTAEAFQLDPGRTLTPEQRNIVESAYQQARQIFQTSATDQELRMTAAMLLVLRGDEEARTYLEELAAQNDLQTKLEAILRLHLAGAEGDWKDDVEAGLQSGNRTTRALAIRLAGLLGYQDTEYVLLSEVRDRSADIAAPAARALARLGNKEAMPIIYEMLRALNQEKVEAARFAILKLADQEIIEDLRDMLRQEESVNRLRIAQLLAQLDASPGEQVLREEFLDVPGLQWGAAKTLARDGDLQARQLLQRRLREPFDTDPAVLEPLFERAELAGAVIQGGDRNRISVLQELLRQERPAVTVAVCEEIVDLGLKALMPVLQPTLQSDSNTSALAAATAAIALANPDFRERIAETDV